MNKNTTQDKQYGIPSSIEDFFLWLVFLFFKPLVTPLPYHYTEAAQALCVKPEIGTTEEVKQMREELSEKTEEGKVDGSG